MAVPNSSAFVTYAFNDAYVPGAFRLVESLRMLGEIAPIVCMIGPEVSGWNEAVLARAGARIWRLRADEVIRVGGERNFSGRYRDNSHLTFTKLNVFRITGYERVLYLDADILAIRSPSSAFEFEPPAAVALPSNRGGGFSAGVMLLRPSERLFGELANEVTRGSPAAAWRRGNTDQALLNAYFDTDWSQMSPGLNVHYKSVRSDIQRRILSSSRLPLLPLTVQRLLFGFDRRLFARQCRAVLSDETTKLLHFDGQKPWSMSVDLASGTRWNTSHDVLFRQWFRGLDPTTTSNGSYGSA